MRRGAFLILLLFLALIVMAPLATPPTAEAAYQTGVLRYRWDFSNNSFSHTNTWCTDDIDTGTIIITDSETGHDQGYLTVTYTMTRICKIVIDCEAEGYPESIFWASFNNGTWWDKTRTGTGVWTITQAQPDNLNITSFRIGWDNKDDEGMQYVQFDYIWFYQWQPSSHSVATWLTDHYTENRSWWSVATWYLDALIHSWIPSPIHDIAFYFFIVGAVGSAVTGFLFLGSVRSHDPGGGYKWLGILVLFACMMLGVLI